MRKGTRYFRIEKSITVQPLFPLKPGLVIRKGCALKTEVLKAPLVTMFYCIGERHVGMGRLPRA
jgi:hypothetical protein